MQIKQHLFGLEETANKNRSDISKLFNDIRNKIVERESTLKKQISETLEKEQIHFRKCISKLERQVETIRELKENKDMIGQESPIETLLLANDR